MNIEGRALDERTTNNLLKQLREAPEGLFDTFRAPEAPSELGVDEFKDNAEYHPRFDGLMLGLPLASGASPTFSDATVRNFTKEFFKNTVSTDMGRKLVTPEGHGLFRHFIRAAELSETITFENSAAFWRQEWPVDDQTAALLRRAAVAFKVPESSIRFNQSTLDQHIPLLEPRQGDPMVGLTQASPVLGLANALARMPELRSGVRRYVDQLALAPELHALAEQRMMLPPAGPREAVISDSVYFGVPDRRKFVGWGGYYVAPQSAAIAPNAKYSAGYKGLPDGRRFYVEDASDDNIRSVFSDQWDVHKRLKSVDKGDATPAEVFAWLLRGLEVAEERNRWIATSSLTRGLTQENAAMMPDYGPESLPSILRIAKHVRVPIESVVVLKRPDGTNLTLPTLLEGLGIEKIAPINTDPRPLLDEFSAATDVADKIDSLAKLQSNAIDAPAFHDIVRTASALTEAGSLVPLRWASLDEAQQQRVSKLLTADLHPGAAVVLAGLLLTELPEGASAFSVAHDATRTVNSAMKTWSAQGARTLASLGLAAKLFVLHDVLRAPPSFESLPTRLWLATNDSNAQEAFTLAIKDLPTAMALRTLVEAAILRGGDFKNDVAELIDAGFRDGSLKRKDIADALSGDIGMELVSAAVMDSLSALAVTAQETGQQADADSLASAIRKLPGYIDRTLVVEWLLTNAEGVVPRRLARQREVYDVVDETPAVSAPAVRFASLGPIEGVVPLRISKQQLRVEEPRLMVKLAQLRLTGSRGDSLAREARQLVEEHFGEALRSATPEGQLWVYSLGRAALAEIAGWSSPPSIPGG